MKINCLILPFSFAIFFSSLVHGAGQSLKIEFQDTQPKYIIDDSGVGGLCVELLQLIAKEMDVVFSYPRSFTPQKRIYANIESGAADIHCGLKRSKEREKTMIFSVPIYSVSYAVLGRSDETLRIDDIADLSKINGKEKILAIFSTTTASFLKSSFPNVDDDGKDVGSNIEKLVSGRGRVLIHYDMALLDGYRRSPLRDSLKIIGSGLIPYNHYLVFSKHVDPDVVNKINDSIIRLKRNGQWQRVLDKYLVATKVP